MKKLTLSILFLLFSVSFGAAQTCDCKIVPYKPASCFSSCTASIIANANLDELQIVAQLKIKIVEKIVKYNKEKKVKTIDDYRAILNKVEFNEFEKTLQSLNKSQLEYFQRPVEEREKDREQLAKINQGIKGLKNIVITTAIIQ